MKHHVQHPEERRDAAGGKVYWRSLEDRADTPEFRQWLEKEFPAGAAEFAGDEVSRRNFLSLMGASLALAGLGMSGCRRPEKQVVAFSHTPEFQVPGRFQHFSSFFPSRRGAQSLLVTCFNGRPVKIEGNPKHPASRGKSSPHAQASLLDLYDPDRSQAILCQGKVSTEEALAGALDGLAKTWAANGGASGAIIVDGVASPTRRRLKEMLLQRFPQLAWAVHEPVESGEAARAVRLLAGTDRRLVLHAEKARVFLALDDDFLCAEHGDLAVLRGFADGRRVTGPESRMNRLYAVEPRYTQTGGMADHRLPLPASHLPSFCAALAGEVARLTGSPALQAVLGGFSAPSLDTWDPAWLREAAQDLFKNRGHGAVLLGANYPLPLQLLVLEINRALDNLGSVLGVVEYPGEECTGLGGVAERLRQGSVRELLVLGGNPVYDAPAALDWPALQARVPLVVHLGGHVDETGAVSTWHIPRAHALESWGDALGEDGSYCCRQPMILPLFGGLSDAQVLARLAGEAPAVGFFFGGPELQQQTFAARSGLSQDTQDFRTAWNLFVRDGFHAQHQPVAAGFSELGTASFSVMHTAPAGPEALEVVFVPDAKMDDGRYANNGWLQEAPEPVTKVTWDNVARVSPATFERLGFARQVPREGIYYGPVVKLAHSGRSLEVPLLVCPGHPDNTLTLSFGYGRSRAGRVGQGVGYNAFAFRPDQSTYFLTGVALESAGREHDLAVTQEHWSMEGRGMVREGPLAYYKEHPDFVPHLDMESHTPKLGSFYKSPPFDYERRHQWGMAIDLGVCVGCNTCQMACQSENNIPIVGKDQVKRGREMHWVRIDRYYSGVSKFRADAGKEVIPNAPEMVMQPVMCMHCENAPCETVCPVNATVHNEEGLNVMAYNRCIGTRYCANNCPYKVRRFNFFDYNRRHLDQLYISGRIGKQGLAGTLVHPLGPKGTEELIKMSKNPNVTVRMRGVIEKCTFCVQRLEWAKIDHKNDPRNRTTGNIKISRDSVQTACQQACPTDAIVFGDLSDPQSRVTLVKQRQHNYKMLAYLNVEPRLSYLARIRNPNPRMPGAEHAGMALIEAVHARHGGGHQDGGHGHDHATPPAHGGTPQTGEHP